MTKTAHITNTMQLAPVKQVDSMPLINPLDYLNSQGLTLILNNNQLTVKPSERVTSDIVGYINTHKTQIKEQLLREQQINEKLRQLNQLTPQQENWFYSVAESLNYPAMALLQQEAIIIEDIIELYDRNPQIIAQCLIAGGLLDRLKDVDKC